MFYEIISKLAAESLLSLYPIFVKNIGLSLNLQMWSRFFSYTAISLFFIDYSFIYKTVFSNNGLLLAFITAIHIYTSYRGFQLLESGIAYTIFYLYPIMILFLAKKTIHPIMIFSLIGVFLLASSDKSYKEHFSSGTAADISKWFSDKEGVIMVLLAALTEAFIYFVVRDIKTENPWNHIFLSYFLVAILLSFVFSSVIMPILQTQSVLSLSLLINIGIGLFGYLLRFFAISRLDPMVYAPLSYFGIFMAYIYGIIFNGESITIEKIAGTVLILFPNVYSLFYLQ
jgi:drug/metabolite transporter (DMT)-like permease